jgi:tetratricopeptide (TPR) repeat protein
LLGQIGEIHYCLGDAWHALPLLCKAVTLAETCGDARLLAAQQLRLATGLQYANRHAEAESVFRQGLAATSDSTASMYADFFLQHLGKCLVEMDRILEAIACFEEALALRRAKDDAILQASTQKALKAARELLPADGDDS